MDYRIGDTLGLGIIFWLVGYITALLLFFSPYANIMGWIITPIFTPVTIIVTWWWFRSTDHDIFYFVKVGIIWTIIAIVFDYLFIVQLFQATYYGPDVFLYYALTFAIPVGVGYYLLHIRDDTKELVKS